MKVVEISFKTPQGKYELFATEEQIKSVLCDELFTSTVVDPKNGDIINHHENIVSALRLEISNEEPEDEG
jgi:hypothetical protein